MKDQKKTKKVRVKEGQIFPKVIKIKKDENPKLKQIQKLKGTFPK